MDCPEHKNSELAYCPKCLSEYWRCNYETQIAENTTLQSKSAALAGALEKIASGEIYVSQMLVAAEQALAAFKE